MNKTVWSYNYQEQAVWSRYLLPPPLPSCTQTLTWTATTLREESPGRSRSGGISFGPRTASWGTDRGPRGTRNKEKSCYSKRGEGSSPLPSHSPPPPPPALTPLYSSLLLLLCWFSTEKPHASHPWRQTADGRREEKHAGNVLSHCHRIIHHCCEIPLLPHWAKTEEKKKHFEDD